MGRTETEESEACGLQESCTGPREDKDTGLEPLRAAPWPGPAWLGTVGGTGRAEGNGPCYFDAQREAR